MPQNKAKKKQQKKKQAPPPERKSIKLSEEKHHALIKRLNHAAVECGMTMGDLVAIAVQHYLDERTPEPDADKRTMLLRVPYSEPLPPPCVIDELAEWVHLLIKTFPLRATDHRFNTVIGIAMGIIRKPFDFVMTDDERRRLQELPQEGSRGTPTK